MAARKKADAKPQRRLAGAWSVECSDEVVEQGLSSYEVALTSATEYATDNPGEEYWVSGPIIVCCVPLSAVQKRTVNPKTGAVNAS